MGIDPAAKTGPRIRRNWGRGTKGGFTSSISVSQPVVIDATGGVSLNISTTGGLKPVGVSLGIKLATNPGLVLSSSGIAILPDPAGATTLGAAGIAVATDNVGIEIATDKLQLKNAGVTTAKLADDSVTKDKLGILTTKGDILMFSTEPIREPVGTDGQQLFADSTQGSGVRWGKYPMGTVTLVAGVATVTDSRVTASTIIMLSIQSPGGTPGAVYVSGRTGGVSFAIASSSLADTSVVGWVLFEP